MIASQLQPLNLPPHKVALRRGEDGAMNVYDPLRKKWLVLTPEEWVRQHFVNWLIEDLHYPPSLIANEVSLRLNSMQKRSDTVVYTRELKPLCIVEYKAPHIRVTQKVFDQIVRYNMVFRAKCLIVSNGLEHYCCRLSYNPPKYEFLENIPDYEQLLSL